MSISITTTVDELADPSGAALSDHGIVLSTSQLLQLAGEAEILHLAVTGTGVVLNCRRHSRLASRWQRRALAARDGGFAFPGCTRPPAWCEAHHVRAWIDGGATDIDNLVLLCPYHHRHFRRSGWDVAMRDGLPGWTPPPWIDSTGRRWRNTAHHPPDLDFARHAPRDLQPA